MIADDRGSVTAFVASFTFALLVLGGLVLDGGRTLTARQEAFAIAEAAARAGAQQLDISAVRSNAPGRLDLGRARIAAFDYLASAGVTGTVEITNTTVHVKVTTTRSLVILRMVGIDHTTVTGEGDARAVRGITQEGG